MADLVLRVGLRAQAEVAARLVVDQIGRMLRLTETRGSRSWPAAFHASRNIVDLLGLELVERHPGVLGQERRAHQVHALLGGPDGGRAGAGAPPDAIGQAGGLRLDGEPAGAHPSAGWPRATAVPAIAARKTSVCGAGHVGIRLALGGDVAERLRSRRAPARVNRG